ncbi:hypothetical protein O181_112595 [Austropuccinia psidii MF-1]|uniref:Uncharacterized protein n=1 Tax=Austropuccinia psidii MF-1 TaxID=1389203 RepID=A0A9Q3K0S9_9BASI|nr:hypothetical protein [Austropuccinia psidii MF-1]
MSNATPDLQFFAFKQMECLIRIQEESSNLKSSMDSNSHKQEESSNLKSLMDSHSHKLSKHEASNTTMENQKSTQMTQTETQSQGYMQRRKHCTHAEAQENFQKM